MNMNMNMKMEDGYKRETGTPSLRNNNNNNNNNNPMEISIAEASSLFPGFRFSPTDEELIRYYLKKKLEGSDKEVEVIPEVDICRHEPWDLPARSIIQSDNEWFFFSPRGKKYPNGSQSKRATESGYWKATGKERFVKSGSTIIGTKRTLVFHTGRAPKGQRTEWIMHEYCTCEKSQDAMVVCRLRKNREFHLNENLRRNPRDQRDLAVVDNTTAALSGGEQSGMVEGEKLADGYSKECSSSSNSHSVEQVDNGSESDEKLTNGLSQHESSSHNKNYAEEEDCYADIMKDDIIKLDDATPGLLPMKLANSSQATISKLPFQGTANRRLRLKRIRRESCQAGLFQKYRFEKRNRPISDVSGLSRQQALSILIDHFQATRKNRFPLMFFFLVMVVLLVSYLFFMHGKYVVSK